MPASTISRLTKENGNTAGRWGDVPTITPGCPIWGCNGIYLREAGQRIGIYQEVRMAEDCSLQPLHPYRLNASV